MRSRRCSGLSTSISPPSDQNAWPPSEASGSWSRRMTLRPASASSAVATRPASPAPMTMASVSIAALYRIGRGRLRVMENQMTAEGLEALRAEIAELEGPARRAIAEEIKTARGFGDLKENAEYHEAKNAQARLETKILQLRHRLRDAQVVEVAGGDVVSFGSTVEVEDEATAKRSTYTLVSALEASASEGRLSAESPVAAALTGLRSGETAVVPAPRGERRLKVLTVS